MYSWKFITWWWHDLRLNDATKNYRTRNNIQFYIPAKKKKWICLILYCEIRLTGAAWEVLTSCSLSMYSRQVSRSQSPLTTTMPTGVAEQANTHTHTHWVTSYIHPSYSSTILWYVNWILGKGTIYLQMSRRRSLSNCMLSYSCRMMRFTRSRRRSGTAWGLWYADDKK